MSFGQPERLCVYSGVKLTNFSGASSLVGVSLGLQTWGASCVLKKGNDVCV